MIDAGLAEKFEVDPIILLLSQFLNRFRHQCWRSATTRSLTQDRKKVERLNSYNAVFSYGAVAPFGPELAEDRAPPKQDTGTA